MSSAADDLFAKVKKKLTPQQMAFLKEAGDCQSESDYDAMIKSALANINEGDADEDTISEGLKELFKLLIICTPDILAIPKYAIRVVLFNAQMDQVYRKFNPSLRELYGPLTLSDFAFQTKNLFALDWIHRQRKDILTEEMLDMLQGKTDKYMDEFLFLQRAMVLVTPANIIQLSGENLITYVKNQSEDFKNMRELNWETQKLKGLKRILIYIIDHPNSALDHKEKVTSFIGTLNSIYLQYSPDLNAQIGGVKLIDFTHEIGHTHALTWLIGNGVKISSVSDYDKIASTELSKEDIEGLIKEKLKYLKTCGIEPDEAQLNEIRLKISNLNNTKQLFETAEQNLGLLAKKQSDFLKNINQTIQLITQEFKNKLQEQTDVALRKSEKIKQRITESTLAIYSNIKNYYNTFEKYQMDSSLTMISVADYENFLDFSKKLYDAFLVPMTRDLYLLKDFTTKKHPEFFMLSIYFYFLKNLQYRKKQFQTQTANLNSGLKKEMSAMVAECFLQFDKRLTYMRDLINICYKNLFTKFSEYFSDADVTKLGLETNIEYLQKVNKKYLTDIENLLAKYLNEFSCFIQGTEFNQAFAGNTKILTNLFCKEIDKIVKDFIKENTVLISNTNIFFQCYELEKKLSQLFDLLRSITTAMNDMIKKFDFTGLDKKQILGKCLSIVGNETADIIRFNRSSKKQLKFETSERENKARLEAELLKKEQDVFNQKRIAEETKQKMQGERKRILTIIADPTVFKPAHKVLLQGILDSTNLHKKFDETEVFKLFELLGRSQATANGAQISIYNTLVHTHHSHSSDGRNKVDGNPIKAIRDAFRELNIDSEVIDKAFKDRNSNNTTSYLINSK